MYIIIAGGGVVGFYTAQFLTRSGNDVVIIEEDRHRAEELANKIDALVIKGDGKEIKTLSEAEVDKADILLALTGSDETNILICMLAKQLGSKRVLCRVTHIEYSQELFKRLGIDSVVYPELATASQIEEMVRDPKITGFAMLDNGNVEVLEFLVQKDSGCAGKKLGEIKLPDKSKVISIYRDEAQINALSSTKLTPRDRIIVLTNKDDLKTVESTFSK